MPNYTKTVRKPTKRQRESARAQAQRERLAAMAWLRRVALVVGAVVLIGGGGVAAYFWHDEPVLERAQNAAEAWGAELSRSHGLVVKQVLIQGRKDTPLEAIKEALGISLGDPIYFISLEGARERLLELPEIREVRLQRMLPDVMMVELREREAMARWRTAGGEVLVDRDGLVLKNKNASDYGHVMLLVGEEMSVRAPRFFDICEGEAALCEKVVGAQWVGGRRWDVGFENGLKAKLPEEKPEVAWRKLAQMEAEHMLSKHLSVIDLRLSDRIFVTKAKGRAIVASE